MHLIERFRQVALAHATRPALVDGGLELTYGELLQRVERAASRGRRGQRVVLALPRGADLIVELLALWSAGQVPVLLDPDVPSQRRHEIESIIAAPCQESESPAYLVSTSGSGGKPRLVEVLQDGLLPMLEAQIRAFDLGPGDRVVWMLSPGFDASLSDIGTALLSGATLCCAPAGAATRLPDVVRHFAGSHLDIPPALLTLYRPDDFPDSLRTLVVGGAPSDPNLLRRWATRYRVVAVYGPSEATICSSLSLVDQDWDAPYIGQPIAGLRYLVRDGELLIGGPGVARGYAGQPCSAFRLENGVRWYRTGDLVKESASPHGLIFAGRRDRQLQLKGQRVEPEEIETRLSTLLAGQAAVVPWGDELAVFWTGAPCDLDSVREQLARSLPEAWMPGMWQRVAHLPRLLNGKIDYGALQALCPDPRGEDSLERARRVVEIERSGWAATSLLAGTAPPLSVTQLKAMADGLKASRPPFWVHQAPALEKPVLLVTGATGRLGRALLPELAPCFRLLTLSRRGASLPGVDQQLQGDLTLPRLGLSHREWSALRVSAVLHLAARFEAGASLEQMNTINARPLLTLAQLGAPIHLASTLSVELSRQGDEVHGAYAQSKLVAEHLCQACSGWIFRYGLLLGTPQPNDLLTLALRGLLELGCYPEEGLSLAMDVTPMDYAAAETRRLLMTAKPTTVPVSSGATATLGHLVAALAETGHRLQPTSSKAFFSLSPVTAPGIIAQLALGRLRGVEEMTEWDLFPMTGLTTTPHISQGRIKEILARHAQAASRLYASPFSRQTACL